MYVGSHCGLKEIIHRASNMEEGCTSAKVHKDFCFNILFEHFVKCLNDNLFNSLLRIGLV